MSFLTKIKSLFGGTAADAEEAVDRELEKLNKDDRLHQRYIIHSGEIAHLRLSDGASGVVKDVSYGGIAVKFSGRIPTPDQFNDPTIATLSVLDRTQAIRLKAVRSTPTGSAFMGFSILHDKPETLIFLRDLIEPLRCGRTLVDIEPGMRNERFRGRDWQCMRGDGPTDVVMRLSQDEHVVEALLTFQLAGSYCDLSFKNGVMRTGRMLDQNSTPLHVGGQMNGHGSLEPAILRHAAFVLIGAPPASRKVCQPLLNLITVALGLPSPKHGAA